jgi:hypothetical protein
VKVTKVNVIRFESATSEFLACSCGNTVMASGFDSFHWFGGHTSTNSNSNCPGVHYQCNACTAMACVKNETREIMQFAAAAQAVR